MLTAPLLMRIVLEYGAVPDRGIDDRMTARKDSAPSSVGLIQAPLPKVEDGLTPAAAVGAVDANVTERSVAPAVVEELTSPPMQEAATDSQRPQEALPADPGSGVAVLEVRPSDVSSIQVAVSAEETAEEKALLIEGHRLMSAGDIEGARAAFKRAVDAGVALGALALGSTYDPASLRKSNLTNVTPDPEAALAWYRQAHILAEAAARKHAERNSSR
jgi:hypothetical protein